MFDNRDIIAELEAIAAGQSVSIVRHEGQNSQIPEVSTNAQKFIQERDLVFAGWINWEG